MVRPLHTSSGAKQEAEPAAVSSNSQAAAYGASAPSAANASYHYAMHSHQQAGYHQMMHHHPHHPSMSNGSHSSSNSPPTVNGASQSHAAASPSSRLPPVVHSGVDQQVHRPRKRCTTQVCTLHLLQDMSLYLLQQLLQLVRRLERQVQHK